MKKILTFIFLCGFFFCFSQNTSKPAPGPKPSQKKYNSALTNSVNTSKRPTCVDKQFSIVFYIVLDSISPSQANYPGVNMATASTLALLMNALNDAFKPICVSFTNCSVVHINNFNYGKTWLKNTTEAYVTGSYYTDKTINFYIVDTLSLTHGNTETKGYSYEPTTSNLAGPKKDLLVIENADLMDFPVTLHQLGHYFGLPHTFDEVLLPAVPAASPPPPAGVVSQEYADGSNCATHGDRFCDTDADPRSGAPKDGMNTYYIPPGDNIMSYYYASRCRFTTEQYNYMADVIQNKRLYLH